MTNNKYEKAMKEFHRLVNASQSKFFTKEETIQWMKLAYVAGLKDG